ncbi:MAG TPA: SDR family oxidoreductase [Planctomycetaceae bacterium]|jgi:NAD(P)-dependent dehydrogenase (short-subunit alcohol dehydrogenase family)
MILKGKTVLITGGRRVGAHLARAVAQRGANVALSYFKSRDKIEAVTAEVRALGVRAAAIAADLRQPADAERLVAQTVAELGSVDVLVNMASEFHPKPFDELQPGDFDDSIASNLKAPYLVAIAAALAMRTQPIVDGIQGKIVNFADWAIDRPYKNFLPYFIAKGGVVAMTKGLAVELAPTIAVNAIAPAMIDPPLNLSAEDIESIRQAAPLKRIGTPADAVNLVLYLLEGTDFTTGNVYRIDGGRFLGTDS